jgi:DNA-binding transcriptional ArsR family regulator
VKLSSDCCQCFAGLSTKARVGIVNLLLEKGQMPVMAIAKHFKLKQPTITHHLQYLKQAGIVDSKKRGRQVFYFISRKCRDGECGLFG